MIVVSRLALAALTAVMALAFVPGGPIGAQVSPPASIAPRFVAPPFGESPTAAALIDRAASSLSEGRAVGAILADPQFLPVHRFPRFRALIRAHADDRPMILVAPGELGELLVVEGTVRNPDGRAAAGALIYVYHTNSKGWYADSAIHISGHESDERYARLFGYLRTGPDGHYQFRTIRPAGYPGSELPGHIHVEITALHATQTLVTEIIFADDPRTSANVASRAVNEGSQVLQPVRRPDAWYVTANFALRNP